MHEHTMSGQAPDAPVTDAGEAPGGAGNQGPEGKRRKGTLAGFATAALVLTGAGAVVAAGSLLPAPESSRNMPAAVAAVPAG
jgi:hypothetical protein